MTIDPLSRFRLDDKVVVLTGASTGLGRGFSHALGAVGARLVLGARRLDLLEEVSRELNQVGVQATPVQTDVTDREQCQQLVERAIAEFGAVDVLINNAGIAHSTPTLAENPSNFRATMDVNVFGTYWMAQACARVMTPGSAIVNISSLHGLTASQYPQAAYAASKAAVIGLTRDLAQQWSARKGIRVNALCPGYFESELTLGVEEPLRSMVERHSILGRFGRQEELDSALLFLASDASSYMTGSTLVIDGGYSVV